MYKLRFQKAGPYQWGDINVVVGDIHSVHTLYNALVHDIRTWQVVPSRLVAEVSRVASPDEDSSPIYALGTFRTPGEPVDEDISGEE